jgi:hypothetical protein
MASQLRSKTNKYSRIGLVLSCVMACSCDLAPPSLREQNYAGFVVRKFAADHIIHSHPSHTSNYQFQDTMSLSPQSYPHSSASEITSKSSSSDSLPQLDKDKDKDTRRMFSILQTITANSLHEESFSTLPGLGHLSFSSLTSTSVTPRGINGFEDSDDMQQLARDLLHWCSMVLQEESSQREPRETRREPALHEALHHDHSDGNDKSSFGPILLPIEMDSLDEILDSYCEATIMHLNNNAESNAIDEYSSSGSTVDSILVYKARNHRKFIDAANA